MLNDGKTEVGASDTVPDLDKFGLLEETEAAKGNRREDGISGILKVPAVYSGIPAESTTNSLLDSFTHSLRLTSTSSVQSHLIYTCAAW